jgi:hypothetical protein
LIANNLAAFGKQSLQPAGTEANSLAIFWANGEWRKQLALGVAGARGLRSQLMGENEPLALSQAMRWLATKNRAMTLLPTQLQKVLRASTQSSVNK